MEKLILCIQFVRYGAVKHHSPRLAGKSDKSFIHDVNQHKRTLSQRRNRFLQVAPAMPGICGKQESGGARRDRTDDLKLAKLPLSQLSYGPNRVSVISNQKPVIRKKPIRPLTSDNRSPNLVGLGRLELPTSRLSSARSNQLSYKPSA